MSFLPSQPDVPPPRPPKPASMKGLPGPPPKGPAPHPPPPSRPPPVPSQLIRSASATNIQISSNRKSQKQVPSQPSPPPPLIPHKTPLNPIPQRPQNPPPHPQMTQTPVVTVTATTGTSKPPPPLIPVTQQRPSSLKITTSQDNDDTVKSRTPPPIQSTSPNKEMLSVENNVNFNNEKRLSGIEARKARRARRRQAVCLTQEDLDNLFKTNESETEMTYMEVAASLASEEAKVDDDDNYYDDNEKSVNTQQQLPPMNTLMSSKSSCITMPLRGSGSGVILPSASKPGSSLRLTPAASTTRLSLNTSPSPPPHSSSPSHSSLSSLQFQSADSGKSKGHKDKNPEYEALLEMAKMEDFGDMDKREFLFTSGYDSKGRTILVLIGANLPSRTVQLDKLFLYFLRTLDPVVEREYVFVYFTKGQSSENRPPFSWLRRAYSLFNRKYKKNLKGLYIVQPTTWLRMILRLFRPFVSKKFWAKVHMISTFEGIYEHISPSQLHLPGSYMEEAATMRPLFGESLETVVQNPSQNVGGIPIIVNDCISYLYENGLDAEGLLRISGNRSLMNEYRLAYDSGKTVNIKECNDSHTVANLLKLYLRELPEPIFTYDLYRPLIQVQAMSMPDDQKLAALTKVLSKLPQANRLVLWHLVSFAAEFATHAEKTKMTPDNIALCLAPTLMWCRPEELSPATAITEMGLVNSIFKTILLNKNCLIDN